MLCRHKRRISNLLRAFRSFLSSNFRSIPEGIVRSSLRAHNEAIFGKAFTIGIGPAIHDEGSDFSGIEMNPTTDPEVIIGSDDVPMAHGTCDSVVDLEIGRSVNWLCS